jgi:hypothetical protein
MSGQTKRSVDGPSVSASASAFIHAYAFRTGNKLILNLDDFPSEELGYHFEVCADIGFWEDTNHRTWWNVPCGARVFLEYVSGFDGKVIILLIHVCVAGDSRQLVFSCRSGVLSMMRDC